MKKNGAGSGYEDITSYNITIGKRSSESGHIPVVTSAFHPMHETWLSRTWPRRSSSTMFLMLGPISCDMCFLTDSVGAPTAGFWVFVPTGGLLLIQLLPQVRHDLSRDFPGDLRHLRNTTVPPYRYFVLSLTSAWSCRPFPSKPLNFRSAYGFSCTPCKLIQGARTDELWFPILNLARFRLLDYLSGVQSKHRAHGSKARSDQFVNSDLRSRPRPQTTLHFRVVGDLLGDRRPEAGLLRTRFLVASVLNRPNSRPPARPAPIYSFAIRIMLSRRYSVEVFRVLAM